MAYTLIGSVLSSYNGGGEFAVDAIDIAYVIFSGSKITISSCLDAVVLIEADIQRCKSIGGVCGSALLEQY